MSKKIKLCISLFLVFAVVTMYSIAPSSLYVYGAENEAEAAAATEVNYDEGEKKAAAETPSGETKAAAVENESAEDLSKEADAEADAEADVEEEGEMNLSAMDVDAEDIDNADDEATEIETESDLRAVLADLNANGGEKTVKLVKDVAFQTSDKFLRLSNGLLTILGGGHKLTASVLLSGTGELNLGSEGYNETLEMVSSRTDCGVFDLEGKSVLNIYDGVTIGPSSPIGTAGGIQAHKLSTVNMYGGTIKDCSSYSVAGGVYLDGNAVFNMYDGTITNCSAYGGGAVGLSGGSPIGGSGEGRATFNMFGGTISNCTDLYNGGGAVNAYTSYPVTINIKGGKIENCSAKGTGSSAYGGGAICLFTFSDVTFHMDGGTITGCSSKDCSYGLGGAVVIYAAPYYGNNIDIQFNAGTIKDNSAKFGGGIFFYKVGSGVATIADGFGLHNNSASMAGDDIYNNATSVSLGTVDTSAILESCGHPITGWYEDADHRWSYEDCTGKADYLVLFDNTGVVFTGEYGLKAAHGEIVEPPAPDPADGGDERDVVPSDDNGTAAGGDGGTAVTVAVPVVAAAANTPSATVTNNPAPTTVNPQELPKAATDSWALVNLICAILTAFLSLIMLIRYFGKRREENEMTGEVNDVKNGGGVRLASIIPAIGAIIAFIITENMANPMIMVDKWTVLMIVILAIQAGVGVLAKVRDNYELEDVE